MSGDFYEFSFNGVKFGINGTGDNFIPLARVSNGSRYEAPLLPTLQDQTESVPGADGTYYWNSFFTQKTFSIPVAFDALTEKQYRKLTQLLASRELAPLWFEEQPYKEYMVKVSGTPSIRFICFDKDFTYTPGDTIYEQGTRSGGTRVYKGEGTLTFVAYWPFARGRFLTQADMLYEPHSNVSEWNGAIGLLENANSLGIRNANKSWNVYNVGDAPCDFTLIFDLPSTATNLVLSESKTNKQLVFTGLVAQNSEAFARYNSKTQLVEGLSYSNGVYTPTGSTYNRFITAGDFFKLPLSSTVYAVSMDNTTLVELNYQFLFY